MFAVHTLGTGSAPYLVEMTSSVPGNASHDLRGLLSRHHDRLDKIFGDLVRAFDVGEREQAARLWNGFEAELAAHFELEERRIFPELACAAPAEAAALECEHDRIREKVAELGVGLDLHLTRADAVAKLLFELKAHADREEALLYRWADVSLDHDLRASIHAHGTALPRKSEPPRAPNSPRLVVYIEDNPSSIALMKDLLADFEDVEMIGAPTAEIGIEIVRARTICASLTPSRSGSMFLVTASS